MNRGTVTAADLYRMIGSGFNTSNGLGYRTATFEIYGSALRNALEVGIEQLRINDEYLVQCSGMRYKFDSKLQSPPKVFSIMINGEALDDTKKYSCTSNEFVIGFLEYLGVPFENVQFYEETEFMILSAVLSQMESIYPVVDSRVYNDKINSCREINQNSSFLSIYPNPATDYVFIDSSFENHGYVSLQISDQMGKVIFQNNNWEQKEALDLTRFSSGVYFLAVKSNYAIHTKRLTIAK